MAPTYFMALLALLPLIMASKSAIRGKSEATAKVVKDNKVATKDVLASSASWTYFTSYPACCPGLPNYDPAAPTTECTQFNRCAHPGNFVALGQRDPDFVAKYDPFRFLLLIFLLTFPFFLFLFSALISFPSTINPTKPANTSTTSMVTR
jgi:hypothetical protein